MPGDDQRDDTELAPQLARLPAGRHGLSPEFVARNHRERLITGLAIAVNVHGYDGATVEGITNAAGVSRATFYKYFSDKESCFVAAFDIVFGYLHARVLQVVDPEDEWPDQVRAGLTAVLSSLASEPELARLCMVESLVAGGEVAAHYSEALRRFIPIFESGRPPRADGKPVPDDANEAVLGGISALLTNRIREGRTEALEDLYPELLRIVFRSYYSPAEAERLAAR